MALMLAMKPGSPDPTRRSPRSAAPVMVQVTGGGRSDKPNSIRSKTSVITVVPTPPTSPAAAAERRTHLTITTVPPPSAGLTAEEAAEAARRGELSFNIQTIFGISIPVIVRSGAVASQVSLGPMELESETGQGAERNPVPELVIPLNRSVNN
jgi:hypothetical protein